MKWFQQLLKQHVFKNGRAEKNMNGTWSWHVFRDGVEQIKGECSTKAECKAWNTVVVCKKSF